MFYILKVPKVKGNSYITMSHQEYGFIVVFISLILQPLVT